MVDYRTNNIDRFQYPFLGNNHFRTELFDEPNNSGEFTLNQGTVVGKEASTGKIVVFDGTATNGGQIPVGIVGEDVVMASGATDVKVPICVFGDVKENALVFPNGESLDTQVTIGTTGTEDTEYTRVVRDIIEGETQGIHLIAHEELSKYDN